MNVRQKNLLVLLAAAGVAGGLGLYAYFGVMRPRAAQVPETPGALFPGAHAEASLGDAGTAVEPLFTFISVDSPLARVVLEQRDGVWRLTSPLSARANRRQVLDVIAEFRHATFSEPVADKPTDEELERYGLKPPRATVSARTYTPDAEGGGAAEASRQHTVTFELGVENTFDGSVYVRREGDPRVYRTHGALRVLLEKDVTSWRDSTLFDVKESSLLRIELTGRSGKLVLERATTEKPWQMAQPLVMRADDKRVARIFVELESYAALGFLEPEWEADVLKALDKPLVTATLVPKRGEPLHIQLVSVKVGGFERTFARSDVMGEPMVAQVEAGTLSVLDPPALDFKSKKVLAVQVQAVDKITIHPGGKAAPLVIERFPETETWEVVAPLPGRAREFKIAALLGALEKLEAVAVVATGAKLAARYGITDTSRRITLSDASGQETVQLKLGDEVPGRAYRTYAQGSSGDIYELSTDTLKALPLTPEELMERAHGTPP